MSETIDQKNASGITKSFLEVCSHWLSLCLVKQIPDFESYNADGSGTSFSIRSFSQENPGQRTAPGSIFEAGGSLGGGPFAGVFGGFGLPSPSDDSVSLPFENLGSVEEGADVLSLANGSSGLEPIGSGSARIWADDPAITPSTEFDPWKPDKEGGPLIAGFPLFDPQSKTVEVPEPFTLTLFVAGMAGTLRARRRKSRRER